MDCNPITEKDLFDDKVGILDIRAKLNNNINCNIEMQVVDRKDIEKRLLFYWSKMYTKSIKSSEKYENLERSIIILITDYNLDNLKKIPDYLTKWNIREEKYPHLILTDAIEIYIIETRKAKEMLLKDNQTLNQWLQFINNPKAVSSMENKEIKKAKKVLEDISQNEKERYLTELREKYIMDQHAIEAHGFDKGLEQGISQGITQGIAQGIAQEKIEIAKKMKNKGSKIDEIIELTGLTEEEINKI